METSPAPAFDKRYRSDRMGAQTALLGVRPLPLMPGVAHSGRTFRAVECPLWREGGCSDSRESGPPPLNLDKGSDFFGRFEVIFFFSLKTLARQISYHEGCSNSSQ